MLRVNLPCNKKLTLNSNSNVVSISFEEKINLLADLSCFSDPNSASNLSESGILNRKAAEMNYYS